MQPDTQPDTFARSARKTIDLALTDNPVVLVIGPRQCGKTTLMLKYEKADRKYFTLDDQSTLITARDLEKYSRGFVTSVID